MYASTYEPKKSSKSKFGAEFVVIITDFGEAARQKEILSTHLRRNHGNFYVLNLIIGITGCQSIFLIP